MRLQEISRWPGDRRSTADVIPYSVLVKAEAPLFVDGKKTLSRVQRPPYSSAMRNILLIILILFLIGAFPGWGYSSGWGYYPFGGIGLVLLIVLILVLTGRL
jgi:Protein of unknown function (DUF3309)